MSRQTNTQHGGTKMTTKQREKVLKDVCKSMYEQIRGTWGRGWFQLGDGMKHAIITERVFHFFAGRVGSGSLVRPEEMMECLQAMRDYCCLGEEVTEDNVSR